MTESVAIVSSNSHSKTVDQEMKTQTDDSIKMNGSVKPPTITSTSSPTATIGTPSNVNVPTKESSLNEKDIPTSIVDLGFDLDQLFSLSLKFFKSYEGKAFHSSYDDRNKLVALSWQVKLGVSTPDKGPQIGAMDFVGRDRRQAWTDLGQMSRDDAIKRYVETVNQLCHLYRPYIEAHWREKLERERLEKEEAERLRVEEEQLREEEEKNRKTREEIEKFDEQKRTIQEALNKQTYIQFVAYAQKAYPTSPPDQEKLIKHLQEKHYEQYMQQVIQQQHLGNNSTGGGPVPSPSRFVPSASSSGVASSVSTPTDQHNTTRSPLMNHFPSVDPKSIDQQLQQVHLQPRPSNGSHSDHESDSGDEEANTSGSSAGKAAIPRIWTKNDIVPFKEAIKKEGGSDGVVKVGHGEIVTIRVPTHPEGSCLFWEFCTDHYDIGFGLLFEWTEEPGSKISVQVQDSEDDEEDDISESSPVEAVTSQGISPMNPGGDVEKGTSKMVFDATESSSKKYKSELNLPTTVIIPIYRRDSQEHVYAGSHVYPGKGVYLMKFDNSYSLWRSKTLYYRVYYTR